MVVEKQEGKRWKERKRLREGKNRWPLPKAESANVRRMPVARRVVGREREVDGKHGKDLEDTSGREGHVRTTKIQIRKLTRI